MVELGGAGKTGAHVPHDPAEKLGPDLHVCSLELVPGKKRGRSSSGPSKLKCAMLPSHSSLVCSCALCWWAAGDSRIPAGGNGAAKDFK